MKYLIKSGLCNKSWRQKVLVPQLAFASIALWLVCAQPLRSQVEGSAISGLINPAAVAFNPTTGKVYTVDTNVGAIYVTDDRANSTIRVKVGAGPVAIAVDSRNGNAYVANAGDGTVSVIDGKADAVTATLPVGSHPYSIAADSTAGKIYVSRTYSDQLTIIDASTNSFTGVKAGSPDLIAVNAKTSTVYLLGYEGGDLTVFEGTDRSFRKTSVGMHAWGMALNEETGALYIAKPGDAEVAVLNAGMTKPTMIPAGRIPCSVAVNSRTNTIYAVNYADNSLTVIDGAKGLTVAAIPVGNRPQAVLVDPQHDLVFVANTLGNSVTVIDGSNNRVLSTMNAGKAPFALAINPVSGKLHVANEDKTSFTILDVSAFQAKSH